MTQCAVPTPKFQRPSSLRPSHNSRSLCWNALGQKGYRCMGDSTYGNSPTLRETIATTGHLYVLEIPKSAPVHISEQSTQTVESLVASIPVDQWRRYALNLSEQGLRWSDWTALRVVSTSDTLGTQWLVVRRTVTEAQTRPTSSPMPIAPRHLTCWLRLGDRATISSIS